MTLKSSFEMVADRDSRVLILGSLPGDVSLRHGEYYAHRRNAFWPLMQEITRAALVEATYAERLAMLLERGVALWDVIQSAEREGSLDADIGPHTSNDLATAVGKLPALCVVAFNGQRAATIGRKLLADHQRPALVTLPSSSPANTMSFARKLEAWSVLGKFLRMTPNPKT